jgi:hypothetical protein
MRSPKRRSAERGWFVLLVAVLTALLASPRSARADPPAAPAAAASAASAAPAPLAAEPSEKDALAEEQKLEAKQHFLRGLELAKGGNWDAALAEFLASRELFPTRVALKNAALSLRHLQRFSEALEMYEELSSRFGQQASAEEQMQTADAIAQLKAMVGELLLEASTPGALVVVDGQQRGTTPLAAPVTVNAGTHSVRAFKEGFAPFESQVTVAGGQRKRVAMTLRALAESGRLIVSEAGAQPLDVLLDGALVGRTPWQGSVSVGGHSVALRGAGNVGTPPVTASIRANQVTSLTLRATVLDAELRVEPTPANARVDIDGVPVGAGVWQGRIPSGAHRVEVYAQGHVPFRRDMTASSGKREVVRVTLERDLTNPMWKVGFRPHLYFELALGGAFAPSLGGSADAACGRGECSDRARPFGPYVDARGGYAIIRELGVELSIGYVYLSEAMTRRMQADFEGYQPTSDDYRDTTSFSAPFAALAASYHLLDKTPLTFRLGAGVARARVLTTNRGTYTGPVTLSAEIPEAPQSLWVPLIAPEVRFGYRLSKHLVLDVGLAAFIFFPSPSLRSDTITFSPNPGERWGAFEVMGALNPRVLRLPEEEALGTFFALLPTLGARFDL